HPRVPNAPGVPPSAATSAAVASISSPIESAPPEGRPDLQPRLPATAEVAQHPAPNASEARPEPPARHGTDPVRRAPRPIATNKPDPNCSPPFTVDATGEKHFKPECFR